MSFKGTLATFKLITHDEVVYTVRDAELTASLYSLWHNDQRRAWDRWARRPEFDWAWDFERSDDGDADDD